MGNTLASQPYLATALRSFGDLDGLDAIERFEFEFGAERGLRKADGDHAMEVVAIALEEFVGLHFEDDIKISRRTSEAAGLAFAGVADASVCLDSCGDFDEDTVLACDTGVSLAAGTRCANDGARAAADGAGASDGEEALLRTDLAAASALLTGFGLLAIGGASAAAIVAGFGAADFDFSFDAEDRLFELELHIELQVSTSLLTRGAAVAPSHIEHLAEEVAEDVVEVATLEGAAAAEATRTVDAGMTVTVIGGALVGVRENLVGLAALLELLLGLRIVRVAVGVELHGELAIRGLDFAIRGGAFDA